MGADSTQRAARRAKHVWLERKRVGNDQGVGCAAKGDDGYACKSSRSNECAVNKGRETVRGKDRGEDLPSSTGRSGHQGRRQVPAGSARSKSCDHKVPEYDLDGCRSENTGRRRHADPDYPKSGQRSGRRGDEAEKPWI